MSRQSATADTHRQRRRYRQGCLPHCWFNVDGQIVSRRNIERLAMARAFEGSLRSVMGMGRFETTCPLMKPTVRADPHHGCGPRAEETGRIFFLHRGYGPSCRVSSQLDSTVPLDDFARVAEIPVERVNGPA